MHVANRVWVETSTVLETVHDVIGISAMAGAARDSAVRVESEPPVPPPDAKALCELNRNPAIASIARAKPETTNLRVRFVTGKRIVSPPRQRKAAAEAGKVP